MRSKRLSRRAPIAYRSARQGNFWNVWESAYELGVAGIGKMGAAIAARLIEVGHEVAVWNRTPEKAKAVAGASVAASPAELAQKSEAVTQHPYRCGGPGRGL